MPDSSSALVSSQPSDGRDGSNSKKPEEGRIDLGDITHHNLKLLKKVNQVVFPVVYHDKFYKDVLEAGELAKLAYYNDIVVGAVCCRVDMSEDGNVSKRRLYIMTLGCLAPYRRLGIGSRMVDHVMEIVEQDGNFDSVFLHVQVNNEGAIRFYQNFGFDIVETKEQYYKRIEPADAHVLEKKLKKNKADVNGDRESWNCFSSWRGPLLILLTTQPTFQNVF